MLTWKIGNNSGVSSQNLDDLKWMIWNPETTSVNFFWDNYKHIQRLRTFLRSDSKCKKKFPSKKIISAPETRTEEDGWNDVCSSSWFPSSMFQFFGGRNCNCDERGRNREVPLRKRMETFFWDLERYQEGREGWINEKKHSVRDWFTNESIHHVDHEL